VIRTSTRRSRNYWKLPNDLSAATKNQNHRTLHGDRQPHLDAAIVRTADDARALLAESTADDLGAIGPYIAPVEVEDSGKIAPGNLREQIRSEGLTIELPVPA
jgi:Protein of unknown function (DUF2849)